MTPAADNAAIPAAGALARAVAKVRRHLLPFLILCYIAAYLDRVNVGFAALTMNADLNISPEDFGFTAGIFFAGYALFEIPSNIVLARVGARVWIARIMITWALISLMMAFVTGVTSLSIARFALGLAEAGFFPGLIYFLTLWVPQSGRGAVISYFMMAVPVSVVAGAPLSGLILDTFNGLAGLKAWQWLFILEALPALLLGLAAFVVLKDRHDDASWLTRDERAALSAATASEQQEIVRTGRTTLGQALTNPHILALSVVYFGIATGLYSLTFWVPQIVKAFGLSNTQTGFVSAIPYLCGALAMFFWGRHSDATRERVWHVALPCFIGGAGMIAGALASAPLPAMICLTLAAIGVFAALPVFWTLPTAMLTGEAAAGAIALINAIGNAGGFFGPYVVGWLKGAGNSAGTSVAAISLVMLLSGAVALAIGSPPKRHPAI